MVWARLLAGVKTDHLGAGRLAKKQRKRTLTDELLADAELNQTRKKRFKKLQDEAAHLSSKRAKQKGGPARLRKQQGKAKH